MTYADDLQSAHFRKFSHSAELKAVSALDFLMVMAKDDGHKKIFFSREP